MHCGALQKISPFCKNPILNIMVNKFDITVCQTPHVCSDSSGIRMCYQHTVFYQPSLSRMPLVRDSLNLWVCMFQNLGCIHFSAMP